MDTTVEMPSGEVVTVHTDSQGTVVTDSHGSQVVTYGGDRHWETVDDYTRGGGSIVGETQNFAAGGEVPFPFSIGLPVSPISSLSVTATRTRDKVTWSISGNLPDFCHMAGVYDWYPGGMIQYVQDPGVCQVFVGVGKVQHEGCSDALKPWKTCVRISPNLQHKSVVVLINGVRAIESPIPDE